MANHTTRQAWVVKSVTTTKTKTADLKPFEIGLFGYADNKAASSFSVSPYIQLACGSPNQQPRISSSPKVPSLIDRNQSVSFKSDKLYGKELLPARVAKPGKTYKGMTATIGWDGINDCTSLDFEPGKTYAVTLNLWGAASKTVFGKEVQDTVVVTMPSRDVCDTNCKVPNICYLAVDELVTKLNNSWVSPAILAEKMLSCCDELAITKFFCREYTLTLCDEGNEMSLAVVQNKYPTQTIKIKSKVGSMTTYSFIQDDLLAAPVAFTSSDLKIFDCATCPVGYTTTAAGKLLVVEIDNAGLATTNAQALIEVQVSIPTATKAIKTGFSFGTSTYVVTVPTGWVMPSPVADTKIIETGSLSPQLCTLTTPISTAWLIGVQTYRVKRTLVITVDNPDCSGTNLPSLVAMYSPIKDVVAASILVKEAGTCKTVFTLDQYSNCMEDGCDTIAIASFKDLPSFKSHVWKIDVCEGWTVSDLGCPTPPAGAANRDCRCGVKLTAAQVDTTSRSCVFDPCDSVNYDPIQFSVSIWEIEPVGEPGGTKILDPKRVPITFDRETSRVYLTGQEVIRDVIKARRWRQNEHYFSPDSFGSAYRYNEAEGTKYGVNVNSFYYAVYITHSKLGSAWNNTMEAGSRVEYALYFEESDYPVMVQFLAAYNSYAMSAGVSLPAIVV